MEILTMGELRAKALKELDSKIKYLSENHSDIAYHRACATAWAYQIIGLITYDECIAYIEKFAIAV